MPFAQAWLGRERFRGDADDGRLAARGTLALDVLVLVLVLSMAALVVTVRSMAEAGLLTRAEVTRTIAGLLMSVFVGCFLWFHSIRIGDDISDMGVGWSSTTEHLGIALCSGPVVSGDGPGSRSCSASGWRCSSTRPGSRARHRRRWPRSGVGSTSIRAT